jgi:penicillin-binding protein 1A
VSYFDPTLERTQCVKNYGGRYYGEVPVRFAIKESLNAAADRVIRDIGNAFAADYLERFGFSNDALPRNVSLALGSGGVTPVEMAGAYAVLANGGYGVQPYFVQRVENAAGELLWDASLSVDTVCRDDQAADDAAGNPQPKLIERKIELYPPLRCAERVETAQRVFLITDVLKEVIKETSGIRANRAFPERTDLAGKTGTTNGPRDAWFAGFNAQIVAVVRVGFDDDLRELGRNEQGGRTAIPAWIDFMRVALDPYEDHSLPQPPGIIERRINPTTGLIAADCNRDTVRELFLFENQPARESDTNCYAVNALPAEPGASSNTSSGSIDLFE